MSDRKHLEATPKSDSPEGWVTSSALNQTQFPLGKSHGRRYVRVELSSPIQLRLLECKKGKIKLLNQRITAEILNLSEGGVLLLTNQAVPEEGFVLLTLNLNKLVILEGVLGKIKRIESSGEGDFIVGVEFAPKEDLERWSSPEQIEQLPVKVASFNHKLQEIITSYLRTAELATKTQ